jgi:DHA1 family multidrug resistance protein-like MFS transporter
MPRHLLLLFLALFLAMIGFGLTLPVLPAFVERLALGRAGTPERVALHVGALTSAYALTQLVLAPLWGWWSDRHGRKTLVVLGLIGVALSQVAFGLGTSLGLLYVARLAGGAFAAALVVAAGAAIADAVPEGERGRAMAWLGTAVSLGFVAGPALGGLLAREAWHVTLTPGHLVFDGFSVPFFVAAGLTLAAVPLVARYLPGQSLPAPRRAAAPEEVARVPVRWGLLARRLGGVLALVLVAQAALTLFEAVFALYADRVLDFGLREIGIAFALCGGVMAVFQGGAVGWLSGRVGVRVQVALGFGMLGVGLLLLPVLTRVPAVLAAVSLLALGVAFVTPNLLTLAADRSGPQAGTGLGLLGTAGGLGQILGPLVGSLLFAWQVDLPFLAAGGVALAVAAGTVGLRHTPRPAPVPVPLHSSRDGSRSRSVEPSPAGTP